MMKLLIILFISFGGVWCANEPTLCERDGGTCIKTASNCMGFTEPYNLYGCSNRYCCKPPPVTATPVQHPANSSCGLITRVNRQPNPLLRIVGGDEAIEGEWPWMVAIMDLAGNQFCGGTLISPDFVVTAAHCFVNYAENNITIVLGEHHFAYQTGNEITRKAHIIVKHSGYTYPGFADDIAFIQLDSPVDTSGHYVRTACLPSPDDIGYTWSSADKCYVSGWGLTKSWTVDPRQLRHQAVSLVSQAMCTTAWAGQENITDNQICAGDGTTGTCQGDSGGPLVCLRNDRYYLVGVTSFGYRTCNEAGYPDVFTRITAYQEWMTSYMLLLHAAV